ACSASSGFGFGRPRGWPSAARVPSSRYLRHAESSEEYSPSRRSNAPTLSGLVQASAPWTILSLYSVEKRRRRDRSTSSGSGTTSRTVPREGAGLRSFTDRFASRPPVPFTFTSNITCTQLALKGEKFSEGDRL